MVEMLNRRIYGTDTIVLRVLVTGDIHTKPRVCPLDSVEYMDDIKSNKRSDNDWLRVRTPTTYPTCSPLRPVGKAKSSMSASLAKFQQMSLQAEREATDDVFSSQWTAPKFDKKDPGYGRPKPGSLTERRGIAAGNHISREIIQLCELINEFGDHQDDGTVTITFGKLFDIYVHVSDKVVGMLLRARRHKIVAFVGEMLYQRQDENVIITMLLPIDRIRVLYSESNDPAKCLKS